MEFNDSYLYRHTKSLISEKIKQITLVNKNLFFTYDKNKVYNDVIVETDNKKIIILNPTSIEKTLFNILHNSILDKANERKSDHIDLVLCYLCMNYIYNDDDGELVDKLPPVILEFDKFPIPSSIIRYIFEPIYKNIKTHKIIYFPSCVVDCCHTYNSIEEFCRDHSNIFTGLNSDDFPIIAVNSSVRNEAVVNASLLYEVLSTNKCENILEEVLHQKSLLEKTKRVISILNGNEEFLLNFLHCLHFNYKSYTEDKDILSKTAQSSDGKYTPEVNRQWSEWSMLLGLIEKQLEGARGNRGDELKNLRPYEEKIKEIMNKEEKKKNKKQLNMEEMLALSRSIFNHKSMVPSSVYEILLRDNRVWKT